MLQSLKCDHEFGSEVKLGTHLATRKQCAEIKIIKKPEGVRPVHLCCQITCRMIKIPAIEASNSLSHDAYGCCLIANP